MLGIQCCWANVTASSIINLHRNYMASFKEGKSYEKMEYEILMN